MWEAVTRCEGDTLLRVMGLWSTQVKVEGIVLKAAWPWGSDSRVINDPLGDPGRIPLYIGLPSAWGSVDSDRMFSPLL